MKKKNLYEWKVENNSSWDAKEISEAGSKVSKK